MDPLGAVWETLVSFFTLPFLALASVMGYLIFFLFFYRTRYWDSVDGIERFFFGFLIGSFGSAIILLHFLHFTVSNGSYVKIKTIEMA